MNLVKNLTSSRIVSSYARMLVAAALFLVALPKLVAFDALDLFSPWRTLQINTAVGFAGLSVTLLAYRFEKNLLARAIALFVGLIGFATLAEHLFFADFGIDQLIQPATKSVYEESPGRMALVSAVCFVLSAVSIFLVKTRRESGFKLSLGALLSGAVASLSSVALIAENIQLGSSVDIASVVKMPSPAAMGFLVFGLFLISTALHKIRSLERERYRTLPVLAGLVLTLLVICAWQYASKQEEISISGMIVAEIDHRVDVLNGQFSSTAQAVERMASRIAVIGTGNERYLNVDAKNYVDQLQLLKRVGITDANFVVKWSYPKELHGQIQGFDQSLDPARREAFFAARERHESSLSRIIGLKSGGPGILMPTPIVRDGKFVGSVYVTIEIDRMFRNFLKPDDFGFAIREAARPVIEIPALTRTVGGIKVERKFQRGFLDLTITITPTILHVNSLRNGAPVYLLLIGGIAALLLVLLLHRSLQSAEERKNFLELEQVSFKRLNSALESSGIASFTHDLQNKKIWRSQNHDRLFGHEKQLNQWTEANFAANIFPEDLERALIDQKNSAMSPRPYRSEFRVTARGGEKERWLRVVTQSFVDDEGAATVIERLVTDVTREKLDELERNRQHEWRKAVLNASEYSVIATDPNGTILTFNRAAEKMLGYTAEEMIGKASPAILHDPEEVLLRSRRLTVELGQTVQPAFETFTIKATQTGDPDVNEWTYIRKDGSRLPVRLSVTAMKDARGRVFGYLGIGVDLSAQKLAQRNFLTAHERLERVIESSGEGIWERDLETKEITYFDEQCRRIFGFEPDAVVKYEDVAERIFAPDFTLVRSEIELHRTQKTPGFNFEFRVSDPNQPAVEKWVRARGRIISKAGKSDQLVSTMSDVTEIVRARHQLEQAVAAAEEATRAKAAFLASMSHEIRTPLNGVIGMTDLLLETELNPQQKNFAKIAQMSGTSLLALVNDILDLSKIDAGKLEIEESSYNVASIVENQIEILCAKAKEKHISIASYISTDIPPFVLGDPARLGQVLLNLIGNSLKFTASGGVWVNVEHVVRGAGQRMLRFEVNDTGIGISPTDLEKLFVPFSQANASITSRFGGTGLGLSICKKIIDSMGGHISAESQAHIGSKFWFEIPLHESTLVAHGQAIGWEKLVGCRTLLLASDPVSARTLNKYLVGSKMRNEVVATLEAAETSIQKAVEKNDPFQLILVSDAVQDLAASMLGKMKTKFGAKLAPAIYISDFGSHEEPAPEAGPIFKAAIPKPVKQSELLDSMVSVLSGTMENLFSKSVLRTGIDVSDTEARSKFRILVADDVAVNQILTKSMLDFLGYKSVVVGNGLEVLDMLKQSKFDLILMDCQMPEMNGFEASIAIRGFDDETVRKIPIVALTANAMTGDEKQCLDAGMNDYLSKPMKKEQLAQKLAKWLIA